jgi:endonuclease/exonuclease/phosphatase family metal-dependent hydrolase
MSFNIWSDAPRNASWVRRRDGIASTIAGHGPDLLGLQEATFPMIRDLEARLGGYGWLGHGRDDGAEQGEFTPVFFRRERLDLREHATFWLAPECDRPMRGWDAVRLRTVSWGRFKDRSTGQDYFHFNTHLDHLGRRARLESAKLLLAKIDAIAGPAPVVLTGDFNCGEASAPYRTLTGKLPFQAAPSPGTVLRDTYYDSAQPRLGPRKTYRGLLSLFGIGRIDYILVKNAFRTVRYEVREDGGGCSDHRPVIADLELQNPFVENSPTGAA